MRRVWVLCALLTLFCTTPLWPLRNFKDISEFSASSILIIPSQIVNPVYDEENEIELQEHSPSSDGANNNTKSSGGDAAKEIRPDGDSQQGGKEKVQPENGLVNCTGVPCDNEQIGYKGTEVRDQTVPSVSQWLTYKQ